MADGIDPDIESALKIVVHTTQQSGNMTKKLKAAIFETVSTLRALFMNLKNCVKEKTAEITLLRKEVNEVKTELEASRNPNRYGHAVTSRESRLLPGKSCEGLVPPSDDQNRKIYSDILTGRNGKLQKLMVKSKQPLPPESIKPILKTSINPTEIKVGITPSKHSRMEES
jgi:hypothetical protein